MPLLSVNASAHGRVEGGDDDDDEQAGRRAGRRIRGRVDTLYFSLERSFSRSFSRHPPANKGGPASQGCLSAEHAHPHLSASSQPSPAQPSQASSAVTTRAGWPSSRRRTATPTQTSAPPSMAPQAPSPALPPPPTTTLTRRRDLRCIPASLLAKAQVPTRLAARARARVSSRASLCRRPLTAPAQKASLLTVLLLLPRRLLTSSKLNLGIRHLHRPRRRARGRRAPRRGARLARFCTPGLNVACISCPSLDLPTRALPLLGVRVEQSRPRRPGVLASHLAFSHATATA